MRTGRAGAVTSETTTDVGDQGVSQMEPALGPPVISNASFQVTKLGKFKKKAIGIGMRSRRCPIPYFRVVHRHGIEMGFLKVLSPPCLESVEAKEF